MLCGQAIRKSFRGQEILRGVDVSVEPGQITTVIGPSGAGKSTLIRSLSLLEPPDSGMLTIDGSTYEFPLPEGTKIPAPWPRVTVVFQQLFLWPHLTLRQNITLPIRSRNHDSDAQHLDELVEMFDMGAFIDRYPNEVSIGQRQRAAIARALLLKPQFVLLDEITSALDVEQVSAVLSHLLLLRDRGIGILIVTHLMGFAERASDKVVFLEDGEVLEAGGPEVLTAPSHERVQRFLSVIRSAT